MKHVVRYALLPCLWLSCCSGAPTEPNGEEHISSTVSVAGLRRSVYGLKAKNENHLWWAEKAREFSEGIRGKAVFIPAIIEIISVYQDDGTCQMGFKEPVKFRGDRKNISFNPNNPLNHEEALTTYDRQNIKAIIQVESGNADVLTCLDLLNEAFGHHPCIIGYGIDAEWFFTKESKDKTGLALKDGDVERWLEKVISFKPSYTLFLKHWEPSHMPPTFRHPNLWFLSDSQGFRSLDEMMQDFQNWGETYKDNIVGFQFGYPKDREWWNNMKQPTRDISHAILKDIPNARFLFWVDFTADGVTLGNDSVKLQPNNASEDIGAGAPNPQR